MKHVAALCTPQVCWMLANARLQADAIAIVKYPDYAKTWRSEISVEGKRN